MSWTEQDFNNWLPTILVLMAIPSFLGAVIWIGFVVVVERLKTKFYCSFGILVFLIMGGMRVLTSLYPDDYFIRFVNAWGMIAGAWIAVCMMLWTLLALIAEHRKRTQVEKELLEISTPGFVTQTLRNVSPERVFEWIYQLHPKDAEKYTERLRFVK